MIKAVNKIKSEKGSYTIETAIIMVIVFMVILLLLVMSLILYEQVRLNAIVQDTAERAAVIYSVAGKDMVTSRVNPDKFKDTSPYWRLMNSGKTARINTAKNYALMKMNAFKINQNRYTSSNISVTYKDYFVYKRVRVELVGVTYKVPFGNFLTLFIDNEYKIEGYAEAAVNEQAEMIRNVDMVADILDELGLNILENEKYKSKIDKIADTISRG